MIYNTEKRSEIVLFFESHSDEEFTLEEICSRLLTDGHGKSTVYRIVSRLVDSGCVRRISDGHTRRVTYQFVGGEHCRGHLHLKCNGCGRLFHLDNKVSSAIGDALVRERGFTLDSGAILFGRCENCGGDK